MKKKVNKLKKKSEFVQVVKIILKSPYSEV